MICIAAEPDSARKVKTRGFSVTNQTKYTEDEKHSHAGRNADSDSFT